MDHPAEEARKIIGEALEAVQEDRAAESQLGVLASTLAKSQGFLYKASRLPPGEAISIRQMRQAMECLARGLQILQDIRSDSPAVGVAASSVAKCLSTLFTATQGVPTPIPATPSSPPPVPRDAMAAPEPSGRPSSLPGAAPPPTMDDRKKKTMQLQLDQVLDLHGDTNFYTGLSGSIDEGGIFIATFDQKPINSKIAVTFKLPSGETIITRGLVRWIREYNPANPDVVPGMGVRFFELSGDQRTAIESYVQQRAPLLYDEDM